MPNFIAMLLHNHVATNAEINENTSTGQNCNTQLKGLSGPIRSSNISSVLCLKNAQAKSCLQISRNLPDVAEPVQTNRCRVDAKHLSE